MEGEHIEKGVTPKKNKNLPKGTLKVFSEFYVFIKPVAIKALQYLHIAYLEFLYRLHLRIRYGHDAAYAKNGWYKKYSDRPITSSIHKATLTGFICSLIFFTLMQGILPLLNPFKAREVMAGTSYVEWANLNQLQGLQAPTNTTQAYGANTTDMDFYDGQNARIASTVDGGTGRDAAATFNQGGTQTLSFAKAKINANASSGQAVVTVTSGGTSGFVAGQRVLVIQMSRTDRATFLALPNDGREEATVSSVNAGANTITLTSNLVNNYYADASSVAQIMEIKQYTSLTVTNSTLLTAPAWDGSTGGIFYIKVKGTTQIDSGSKIDMTGRGYRSGEGPGVGGNMAGGTYGGVGGQNGAATYGTQDKANYMGCGGYAWSGPGTTGTGGGFVSISTPTLNISGSVQSNGAGGNPGTGGGSGGGITLIASTISLTGKISAAGGGGGGAQGSLNWSYNNGIGFPGADGTGGHGGGGNGVNMGGFGGGPGSPPGSGGNGSCRYDTDPSNGGYSGGGGGDGRNSTGSIETCGAGGGGAGRIVYNYGSVNGTTVTDGYADVPSAHNASGPYPYFHYILPNKTAGTIGGTASTVGLRAQTTNPVGWSGITATYGTPLVAGQAVKFLVKLSTDGTNWTTYDRTGATVSDIEAAFADNSKYFGQVYGGTFYGTIPSTLSKTRYIDLIVRLASSGANTPKLSSVRINNDFLEVPANTSTTLKKSDSSTILKDSTGNPLSAGAAGGWNNESTVKVTTTGLTCNSCGTSTQRKIEVEVQKVGTAFTNTPNFTGDYNDVTFASTATLTGLDPTFANGYHLQLRVSDQQGRVSAWTSYASDAAAFTIEQTVPTVTSLTIGGSNVSSGYAKANAVTLTVNGAVDTGGSGLSQMRFSNDGVNWGSTTNADGTIANTNWATYSATAQNWNLLTVSSSVGDGAKTVYVQVRDNAGNVSDSWAQHLNADFSAGTTNQVVVNTNNFQLQSTSTTSTYTVAASVDDSCEMAGTSYYSDAGLVNFFTTRTCALRWQLNIPKGATIISANMKMTGYMASSTDSSMVMSVFDSDSSPDFSTVFSSRATMAGSAMWNVPSVVVGQTYTSPDISSLVANYIARSGYNSGNYIGFKTNLSGTSDGAKRMAAYDNGTGIPQLVVAYTASGNIAPFYSTGSFISSQKDTSTSVKYGKLSWSANIPSQAGANAVRFQIASNNDNSTWNYLGPDGTSGTYYTTSDTQVWGGHNGNSHIKYKAYLQSASTSYTPQVSDVVLEVTGISASTTLDTASPNPPSTSLSVTPNVTKNSSASLSWAAATDSSGIKEYHVYRKKESGGSFAQIATVTAPTTSYSDTYYTGGDATYEGAYYYEVSAVDTPGNEGAKSADFPTVICDRTAPNTPSAVSATPSSWSNNNSFNFAFTASDPQVSSQNAANIKKFHYRIDQAPDATHEDGVVTITEANPGSGSLSGYQATVEGTHNFYVVAEDSLGNVDWGHTVSTQFKYDITGPVPPSLRYSASESGLSTVQLYWDTATDPSGIVAYKIRRKKAGSNWGGQSTWVSGEITDTSYLDNTSLESGFRYNYTIQAKDGAGNWGAWTSSNDGNGIDAYTKDDQAPNPPPVFNVTDPTQGAFACTSSNNPCDATDGEGNPNTPGFSIKISWTSAVDSGVGMAKYLIYRSTSLSDQAEDWKVVGVQSGSMPSPNWYDNDVHNDVIYGDDKPSATDHLNDYTTYYYRIVAVDAAVPPNKTLLFPTDTFQNLASTKTPDVTAPSVPTGLGLSPGGPDSTGQSQIMLVHWIGSTDKRALSQDDGSGVDHYNIYRFDPNASHYLKIGEVSHPTVNFTEGGLGASTDYTYKITAVDKTGNESSLTLSTAQTKKTASNSVPSIVRGPYLPDNSGNKYNSPRAVAKKGNPTDNDPQTGVGHLVTVTFTGSKAKDCGYDPDFQAEVRCLVRYELWRSETNWGSNFADWQDATKATKINEFAPIHKGDDTSTPYTFDDKGLNDSTTYYYAVIAFDNTPQVPDGGPFHSPVSAVFEGDLNAGWDTTPDVTKPNIPSGGLEVQVRDTHPNELELRNIVTWKMLSQADLPKRKKQSFETCTVISTANGFEYCSDFDHYEVHREVLDPSDSHVLTDTKVKEETTLDNNYFIDVIPIGFSDSKYKYYVQIVDNADTGYKYEKGTVINPPPSDKDYSNFSDKEYWSDTIIPAKSHPSLEGFVTLGNVGVAKAEITWRTDQEADSLVQFRLKGSSADWVAVGQIEKTLLHNVRLFGLEPAKDYEYRIVSRNYLGNNIDYDVNALPPLHTNGFSISNIAYTATTTSVSVNWKTNIQADGNYVEYQMQNIANPTGGTVGQDMTPVLDKVTQRLRSDPPLSTTEIDKYLLNHNVVIGGLKSNQQYSFKLRSVSTDGYVTYSDLGTFTTKSFDTAQFSLAPSSSNVAERNINATTAQIVWQTAIPTTSWIEYGTKSGAYGTSAGDNVLTTTHIVLLEGLVPGTKYFYRARVKDINDVEYTSEEYSFTAVLKPKIENLQVKNVTPYSVTLSWETNVETETLINWGTTSNYGEKRGTQGTSKAHELKIEGLEDNQEYHYQILAHDAAGNEVADSDKIVRTPLDTEGPQILDVKTDVLPIGADETFATVVISWSTNKPATTLIQYDEGIIGGKYTKSSIEDKSLNTSHTVIIKDLKPASSYHYKIVSRDKRSNLGQSPDHTFVTPTKEKSILQLILKALEETFSWTKNINKFFGNVGKRLGAK